MNNINPEVYFDTLSPNSEVIKIVERYIDEMKFPYTNFGVFKRIRTNTFFKYRKDYNYLRKSNVLDIDNLNFYRLCLFIKSDDVIQENNFNITGIEVDNYKIIKPILIENQNGIRTYKILFVFNDLAFSNYSIKINLAANKTIEDVTGVIF